MPSRWDSTFKSNNAVYLKWRPDGTQKVTHFYLVLVFAQALKPVVQRY
jgi:hypothetical protein